MILETASKRLEFSPQMCIRPTDDITSHLDSNIISVLMSTKWFLIGFHAEWKIVAKCHARGIAKWPQEEKCARNHESVLTWKETERGAGEGRCSGIHGSRWHKKGNSVSAVHSFPH